MISVSCKKVEKNKQGNASVDLVLSNQYERMVHSIKGKRILGDSCHIILEFELAKEEIPRYGQK